MAGEPDDLRESRRGPAVVALLFLLPALGIGLNQLRKGGRELVWVVGAGPLAQVRAEDAPQGYRYTVEVQAEEANGSTVARIEARLRLHPTTIVFGLAPGADLAPTLERLLDHTQEAAIGSVVLGPAGPLEPLVERRFKDACRRARRVVCVDPRAHPHPTALRAAIAQAVLEVGAQVRALRATTQAQAAPVDAQLLLISGAP